MNQTTSTIAVVLDGYAAKPGRCWTALHHDRATDRSLAAEDTPAVAARKSDGTRFEAEVIGPLLTAGFIDLTGVEPAAVSEHIAGCRGVSIPDCDRSVTSKQLREELTVAAMAAGAPVVWNARLPVDLDAGRSGEPDVLVAVADVDGVTRYAPVDVKHHKSLTGTAKSRRWKVSTLHSPQLDTAVDTDLGAGSAHDSDDAQLAHYHRMLQAVGFAQTDEVWGAVIGKEQQVVWRRLDVARGRDGLSALDIYDATFAVAHDVARHAAAAKADPTLGPLVPAERQTACAECPWRVLCADDLAEADDITLLPGITPGRARVHRQRGINTRAQLARLDHHTAALVDRGVDVVALRAAAAAVDPSTPVTAFYTGDGLGHLAGVGISTAGGAHALCGRTAAYSGSGVWNLAASIEQARVAKSGKPHRARGVTAVPVTRTTFELDVDIEDADGRCYLIGVADTWRRTREGSVKTRTDYHSFVDWTHSDTGEARVFAEFWAYLMAQKDKAEANRWGFRVYHYTQHETRYFRHLAKKYVGFAGVPTLDELEAFFVSGSWVDLHPQVVGPVIWPTEDHGLKSLAKLVGFDWRDETPGGANSIAWYADAIGGDTEQAQAARQRLLDYNEDDVLATLALRDWLARHGAPRRLGQGLPSVEVLDRRFRRRR